MGPGSRCHAACWQQIDLSGFRAQGLSGWSSLDHWLLVLWSLWARGARVWARRWATRQRRPRACPHGPKGSRRSEGLVHKSTGPLIEPQRFGRGPRAASGASARSEPSGSYSAACARGTSPGAIGVAVHSHPHLDEVTAVGLGGELEPTALEAHAVVSPDGALVVLAHDVGQARADEGHERAAGLRGGHRELLVERRAVVLGQ